MITIKLNESYVDKIYAFCISRKEFNFFILANIEQLHKEQNLVTYYGQFDACDRLVALMMSFHKLWYFAVTESCDYNSLANTIQAQKQPEIVINDSQRIYENIIIYMKNYQTTLNLPGELYQCKKKIYDIDSSTIKKATKEDTALLVEFYKNTPQDVRRGKESIERSIGNGRRTFIDIHDKKVIACALTTGERTDSAMIGGIHSGDAPNHLNGVITGIANDLIQDGKTPYIVVRDSEIQKKCLELGFTPLGQWHTVHLNLDKN